MRTNYGRRHGKSKAAVLRAYAEAARGLTALDAEAQIAVAVEIHEWIDRRIRRCQKEAARERKP